MRFIKGHGTQNDFILIEDYFGEINLTPELIANLCNRRVGIGADGLIRIIRTDSVNKLYSNINSDFYQSTDWFMDYYNANGSVAQMCGNGIRVMADFLTQFNLVLNDTFTIGTRAGVKALQVIQNSKLSTSSREGLVKVDMGEVKILGKSNGNVGEEVFAGIIVDVGNPHLVCILPDKSETKLAALDLTSCVAFDKEIFPAGVNIEFITRIATDTICMRVWERGVGETKSCGTGTVAAVAASKYQNIVDSAVTTVLIPGGKVKIAAQADNHYSLTGPAQLVAIGEFLI